MNVSLKQGTKTSKGLYLIMALSMAGVSSIPMFFKLIFSKKPSVVTVNEVAVSKEEFLYVVHREERILSAYKEKLGSNYQKFLKLIGRSERADETALEQIIIEKLLLSVAKNIGIELSHEFISHELSQLKTLYGVLGELVPHYLMTETGLLRIDLLKRFLQSQGLTLQVFEEMVECFLKEQLVMRLALGGAVITQDEVAAALASSKNKIIQLEKVGIKAFYESKKREDISTSELMSFYEKENRKKSRYWSAERRSGTLWKFNLSNFEVTSTEVEPEFSADKKFLLEAESVAQPNKGKEFSRFLAKNGGIQSSFTRVQKTASSKAVQMLFEIETIGGFEVNVDQGAGYIVQLDAISPREQLGFENIEELVAEDYMRSKAQEEARQFLRSQKALSDSDNSDNFEYQKKSLQLSSSSEVPESISALGLSSKDLSGLFARGSALYGETEHISYKITLTELQDKAPESEKDVALVRRNLWEKKAELVQRNFIASLRDRAILTVQTKELVQAPSK